MSPYLGRLKDLGRSQPVRCLILTAVIFISLPALALAEGPVAYWDLDESGGPPYAERYDPARSGLCAGACPSAIASPINGAQQFNGTDTGLALPASAAVDWAAGDSFSIELWLKGVPGQTCAGSDEVLAGWTDGSGQPLWALGCLAGSGRPYFRLGDTGGLSVTLTSTLAITSGHWFHLAGVRDGAGQLNRLFVNGTEVASTSVTYANSFSPPTPLNLGWLNSGSGFYFEGSIDEVAVYTETLSLTDIKTHTYLARDYTAGCAVSVPIMPLGDSITRGNSSGANDSSQQISYRKDLWELLLSNDYRIDFVGNLTHGQFYEDFPAEHEGHSGSWIKHLGAKTYLSQKPAEVVLLHIGTNGTKSVADLAKVLDDIETYETDNKAIVTVILARIINRLNGNNTATTTFNQAAAAMAEARIAAGDRIIIVDMETGAGLNYAQYPAGDMWDWAHPYASGYGKMAAVWFEALRSFLPRCEVSFSLSVAEVGSGSVLVNPAPAPYDFGQTVTMTAVATPGWVFSGWSGDRSGSTNPLTLTMTASKSVTATFSPLFSLTVYPVGQGGVTVEPAKPWYSPGEIVTMTAVATPGWNFGGWAGALSGSTNPLTVTMNSHQVISATFVPIPRKGYLPLIRK